MLNSSWLLLYYFNNSLLEYLCRKESVYSWHSQTLKVLSCLLGEKSNYGLAYPASWSGFLGNNCKSGGSRRQWHLSSTYQRYPNYSKHSLPDKLTNSVSTIIRAELMYLHQKEWKTSFHTCFYFCINFITFCIFLKEKNKM